MGGNGLTDIGNAEDFMHSLGIKQLRVRDHGTIARMEVEPKDFTLLTDKDVRSQITKHFRSIGYSYITLDMDGLR